MEDLNNSNLQLVLGIKEGCNFDRLQKPTIVTAALNNHCLESKKIHTTCNPQYTTDLTWEIDKNTLRIMRCNQTPIKVECFTVNENGSRDKFGYVLLSVRCAQIIPPEKKLKIKTTWHNILGMKGDFNNYKPKLLLYLIIKRKYIETVSTTFKNEQLFQSNCISSNIIPVWMEEEQIIQIGSIETCQDLFHINIIAEIATNLNELMQEFKENANDEFFFTYNIFDTHIRLKAFNLASDKIYLNEKTFIRIRTSLPTLLNYLNIRSHFVVELKNKNVTLALSEVNIKPLINTSCLQEFKQINKNAASSMNHYCTLKYVISRENKGDYKIDEQISKLPSLKIYIKLQYIESKNAYSEKNALQLQLIKKGAVSNYLQKDTDNKNYLESNSQVICKNLELCNSEILGASYREKVADFNKGFQIHNSKSPKHISLQQSKGNNPECTNTDRNYCLNIYLNEIKFFDSRPDVKAIEFRFYDSQNKIIAVICNGTSILAHQSIKLEGVKCKIHFVSTSDKIKQLLRIFTPKINVCSVSSNERKCIAQIFLDTEMQQYQYETTLIDCHSHQELGYIYVTHILEDHAIPLLNKIKERNSESTLNNNLAYKIVDELETWKERQKEIFKDELQKKEEAHLTLLNQEWQRCRESLESKLANNVQQCKILANNLNKTTENLRFQKMQSLEKETKLIQENEKSQGKYDIKLHQLQNALQKMQEEFILKLTSLDEQNQNLILQIKFLNEQKYELEKIKTEQTKKLEAYKKAFLTEDQTASVLQQLRNLEEKLDNVQKSKTFFKKQWDKAVKEIHRIKIKNQKAIESQIKSSNKELHDLDLEKILHADSTALAYDQIALNEIQQEINIINPEMTVQYYNTTNSNDQSDLYFNLCLNQNFIKADTSATLSVCDRKLYK